MSIAHFATDACTWLLSVFWVIGFLARGPKYRARNRRLPKPSPLCERTGQFEINMGALGRRQAE